MRSFINQVVLGAVVLATLVTVVAGATLGRRVVLIAQSNISVAGYPDPNSQKQPLQVSLTAGQQVEVMSCNQLKAYRAVHVRLENGAEGYIIDGKYELKRYSPWSKVASPISFSCSDDWP